jgi:GrpB-like predicted nucleotidyltransferase (UPF0157 family)
MMVGVAAGVPRTVFVDSDARYPAVFARVVDLVRSVAPAVTVDHVGSTAVAGLGGRGVLDVVVACPRHAHQSVVWALHRMGWTDAPFGWIKPMLTGTIAYAGGSFPVLAYVLDPNDELRRGLLATRDRLRRDPAEVQRYAAVKRAALAAGRTAPWDYQQAKTPYLRRLATTDSDEER